MKAYFAVVKDAFRAAMAAKTLYVMFVLIVLFLIVLAPLSYFEALSSTLREFDIRNPTSIGQRLYDGKDKENTSSYVVWNRLGDRTQELIQEYVKPSVDTDAPGEQFNRINQVDFIRQGLHRDFREMIDDPGFYDAKSFADLELGEETGELAKRVGSLSEEESKRLNRLLLDDMFPIELATSAGTMLTFTYMGFEIPLDGFTISQNELTAISTITIPWILDKFVLSIGVLVAILFTANMIPEMLEPGSLNLLLSKPVRRWGLFVSKYLGACVFSLLNASLLFIGLWLILGTRLGIWNVAFLLCIPIYVFVFGIYYSVSALVGLLTRSAILSIISAILFWLFCFTLGTAHIFIDASMDSRQPARFVVAGDEYIKFDRSNRASIYDESNNEWNTGFISPDAEQIPAFMRGMMPSTPMLGPFYDESGDRFVAAQVPFSELGSPFSTNRNIVTAEAQDGWITNTKMKAPAFTRAIYQDDEGSLIAVTFFGKIQKLTMDAVDRFEPKDPLADPGASTDVGAETTETTDNSTEIPTGGNPASSNGNGDLAEYFEDVSPTYPLPSERIEKSAYNPLTRDLAFYGQGVVTRLRWNGERYEWGDDDRLGLPVDSSSTTLCVAGDRAYVGMGSDAIYVADFSSGEVAEYGWPSDDSISSMIVDPEDRQLVILDEAGVLWQLVPGAKQIERLNLKGQGKLRALSQGKSGEFWTIDAYARMHSYRWGSNETIASASSSMGLFQSFFVYGLNPVYWLSPKPGEFYRVVIHVADMMNEEAEEEGDADVDVVAEDIERNNRVRSKRSPWLPIWNGIGFIIVMIGIATWIFERQDF